MHVGCVKVLCWWYAGFGSEGALVDMGKIGGSGMGLAYIYYVCVCYTYYVKLWLLWRCQCTHVLTRPGGLLGAISRRFCHCSEHWVSRYFFSYDFFLLWGLARFTFCGIGELVSLFGGSKCLIPFCMRSSSMSKGTACISLAASGYHKHQRKCWMVWGRRGIQPQSKLCKLQFMLCTRRENLSQKVALWGVHKHARWCWVNCWV